MSDEEQKHPADEVKSEDGKAEEDKEDEEVKEEVKEDAESPQKESKKVTKSPKKESKKTTAPSEEESGSSDEDTKAEDLPPGLLEQPLEVEGKREKKKVERLSASMVPATGERKKVEIEEGAGEKLGEIPFIDHQLNTAKALDLKSLHRVLFLRLDAAIKIKRNIRQFCGFTHGKDTKEYEKRTTILNKMVNVELKNICLVLGLDRSGTKGNLVDRIMEFLIQPDDKGLKIKAKRRSKSAGTKKGKKRKRTPKSATKKTSKAKAAKNEETDDDDEEEDDESENEEDEDDVSEEEEEESEEEPPPKKKKKVVKVIKKKAPKKSSKENGKKEKTQKKVIKKAKPAKPAKPAKKPLDISDDDDDDNSDDSDDQPIARVKKTLSPPSNDDIKSLVKNILDGADLETVTMKTVVKQVYAKYPSFDLSDRKDFIKDAVREVIS